MGVVDTFEHYPLKRELEGLFGKPFWKHVVIGVSRWAYSVNDIMERNNTGKNEAWYCEGMNFQLKEKFHLENDRQCLFIDSWSQQTWNLEDKNQQDAFTR